MADLVVTGSITPAGGGPLDIHRSDGKVRVSEIRLGRKVKESLIKTNVYVPDELRVHTVPRAVESGLVLRFRDTTVPNLWTLVGTYTDVFDSEGYAIALGLASGNIGWAKCSPAEWATQEQTINKYRLANSVPEIFIDFTFRRASTPTAGPF